MPTLFKLSAQPIHHKSKLEQSSCQNSQIQGSYVILSNPINVINKKIFFGCIFVKSKRQICRVALAGNWLPDSCQSTNNNRYSPSPQKFDIIEERLSPLNLIPRCGEWLYLAIVLVRGKSQDWQWKDSIKTAGFLNRIL